MADPNLDRASDEQVATGLGGQMHADESTLSEPEAWELWETKLVLWSLVIGVAGLIVLGILINKFLL